MERRFNNDKRSKERTGPSGGGSMFQNVKNMYETKIELQIIAMRRKAQKLEEATNHFEKLCKKEKKCTKQKLKP